MATKWSTVAPGIRCREHEARKHGLKHDRYFAIRFYTDGVRVEEALGWASESWSVKRAQEELGKLREAKRTGAGEATMRAKREAALAATDAARREVERKTEDEAQQERQEITVAALWDRYWKEIVVVENRGRTIPEKRRLWLRRIEPAIGALKVKNVTEADATALIHSPMRLDSTGAIVGGKAEAANIFRLLRHLFGKALVWKVRPKELGNPVENITEPKVPGRERLLTGGEVGALIQTLEAAAKDEAEFPQVLAIIWAEILTGARISELLTLRWDFIRPEEGELHLPGTKTGFSRRPISADALALLMAVERMPGVPWVFRGVQDPTKPLDYSVVRRAFLRLCGVAGIKNASPHTVRHWFATMTANSVSNPSVGMALTGHKSHGAYMGYVHSDKEQAHALADQLAALTRALGKAQSPVVPMHKRGGA